MSNTIKIFGTLITISFLLIIGIVLRYTQAADVSTSAEIQNTPPTVDTIRFATTAYSADDLTSSGILPNVGTTRTIHINGQIHDDNGEADIASSTLNLVFHKTTATNTCTADQNDCYRITTCTTDYTQGSDTEISYNCEVPIQYFIDATDEASIYPEDNWSAYVEVEDFATAQGTLSATIEVNSLLALNLPDGIDYGTRSLGEQSSSTTKQTSKYQEILWTVMHSVHFLSRHRATHSLMLAILTLPQLHSQVLLLLQNGTLTFVLMKAMNSPQTFTGTLLFLRVA